MVCLPNADHNYPISKSSKVFTILEVEINAGITQSNESVIKFCLNLIPLTKESNKI